MAKRKAQTSAKPRSGTKTRSKVKRAKPVREHNTRAKSKQAAVVALLPAAGRHHCGHHRGDRLAGPFGARPERGPWIKRFDSRNAASTLLVPKAFYWNRRTGGRSDVPEGSPQTLNDLEWSLPRREPSKEQPRYLDSIDALGQRKKILLKQLRIVALCACPRRYLPFSRPGIRNGALA
jgi:hypothetical protein